MMRIANLYHLIMFSVLAVTSLTAGATIIYSNDFETNTDGFNTTGTGTFVGSTWLGGYRELSNGITILTLNSLTVGAVYDIAFDLRLGGSWDGGDLNGSASFGPDYFTLNSSSVGNLINATFVNDFPQDPITGIGTSGKVQTYSDNTPLGGANFAGRTGADVATGEPIYYFGRGTGNPLLSFTASSAIETLTFSSSDAQLFAPDEYFSLDNVVVTGPASGSASVPEPTTLALFGLGLLGLRFNKRKRLQ